MHILPGMGIVFIIPRLVIPAIIITDIIRGTVHITTEVVGIMQIGIIAMEVVMEEVTDMGGDMGTGMDTMAAGNF
jgi:hypothetical protein